MISENSVIPTNIDYNPHIDFPDLHPLQGKIFRCIQNDYGRKTYGFLLKENDITIGYVFIIEYKLFMNKTYLYSPYGPYLIKSKRTEEVFNLLINRLEKKENIFIRFTKFTEKTMKRTFSRSLSRGSAFASEFEKIINIDMKEEDIFNSFHSKLRYSIRYAGKKDITVKIYKNDILDQYNDFYNLLKETGQRNTFSLHTKKYMHCVCKVLQKNKRGFLAVGYVGEKKAAAYLILQDNEFAYYLYGGSSAEYRKNGITEYTLWECIKRAKRLGAKKFYLGGAGYENKNLAGIRSFKAKFVQKSVHYKHVDYIFNKPIYFLYTIYKKIC